MESSILFHSIQLVKHLSYYIHFITSTHSDYYHQMTKLIFFSIQYLHPLNKPLLLLLIMIYLKISKRAFTVVMVTTSSHNHSLMRQWIISQRAIVMFTMLFNSSASFSFLHLLQRSLWHSPLSLDHSLRMISLFLLFLLLVVEELMKHSFLICWVSERRLSLLILLPIFVPHWTLPLLFNRIFFLL